MNTGLQAILQEQFLNKQIIVPIVERDQVGKIMPNRFTTCSGVCTFIGSNKIIGWELQVTIDLMPLPVKHVNDIQLAPEVSRIRK